MVSRWVKDTAGNTSMATVDDFGVQVRFETTPHEPLLACAPGTR